MTVSPFAWRGVVEGFYGVYYNFPKRSRRLRRLGAQGFAGQSWTAAMYLFAHDAVTKGRVSVFNPTNGWALNHA